MQSKPTTLFPIAFKINATNHAFGPVIFGALPVATDVVFWSTGSCDEILREALQICLSQDV
jgi:hypothetical protein